LPVVPLGTGSSDKDPVNKSMSATLTYKDLSLFQFCWEISFGLSFQLVISFLEQRFL
jgi:hypothetical protein